MFGEVNKNFGEILLPRFIYKDFFVIWNRAGYLPGGAVIQFIPKKNLFTQSVDIKVYLAILTSSFSEIVFRRIAQVYGGGTFNLRITNVKDAPTIDIAQLTAVQKKQLVDVYNSFLRTGEKRQIDRIINKILALTDEQIKDITELLVDLRGIAISAKKQ
jgi:hypothetical protein